MSRPYPELRMVTFADSRMRAALRRIERQAADFKLFDRIPILDMRDRGDCRQDLSRLLRWRLLARFSFGSLRCKYARKRDELLRRKPFLKSVFPHEQG